MPRSPKPKPTSLAAMPGIVVVLTLGYLFVMHLGHLKNEPWQGRGLERAYADSGSDLLGESVHRTRARLGLIANEVLQREDELYYLPDIEHVVRRSFRSSGGERSHVVLRPNQPDQRVADPVPCIREFDRALRVRGVRLVLLPTPSKAMFVGPGEAPLRNAGFAEFLAEMKDHDIPVFDPAPHLSAYQGRGNRLFLRTDSHWTPEAMRICALFLAAFLERQALLPAGEEVRFEAGTTTITNAGDLAKMISAWRPTKWQETIEVHPLSFQRNRVEEIGPWEPDPDSPLLLLGDSFTNVFSSPGLGWGADGGLAEVLSQSVGYRVDRLARNGEGAFGSRQELQHEAARLENKKVVVWQFAARELSLGDWKILNLPKEEASRRALISADQIELEGTIKAVAPVPPLNKTPYRQAVMEILLTGVRSENAALPEELVLLGMGVEDRNPTAMTRWQVGQEVKVEVVPWREVQDRFARLHRFALDDPELQLLEAVRVWRVDD